MNGVKNFINKYTYYNHVDSNHELNIALAKEIKNGKIEKAQELITRLTSIDDKLIIYICNKGSRGRIQTHNFQIFHFDPEKFTESTVKQLIETFEQEKKLSVITLYKKILQKIAADANEGICEQIQKFIQDLRIFKDHKRDNCGTANFKPILFFVLCIDRLTQFSELNQPNNPNLKNNACLF